MYICLYMNQTYQIYSLQIADIFFYSICYLFILLIISFAVQKFLNLTFNFAMSKLFIFVYVACAFGVISMRSFLRPMSRRFYFMGFFFIF